MDSEKTRKFQKFANNLKDSEILYLDLNGYGLGDNGAMILAKVLASTKITWIDLGNNKIGPVGATAIAKVLKETRITHINLQNNEIGEGVRALMEVAKNSKITYLNLGCNPLSCSEAKGIAEKLEGTNIISLELPDCELDNGKLIDIVKAIENSGIVSLDLGYNRSVSSGDEVGKAIGLALKRSRIISLNLEGLRLGATNCIAIAESLKYSRITWLDLGANKTGNSGALAIAKVLKDTRIIELKLRHNDIGLIGAVAIIEASKETGMTHLNLADNPIKYDREGGEGFADALKGTKITYLDLTRIKVDPRNIVCIIEALRYTRVSHLILDENWLGYHVAVITLSNVLKDTGITFLQLRRNQIDAERSRALAIVLKDTKIVDLDLTWNHLTNKGAVAIFNGLDKTKMTTINFSANMIASKGAIAIVEGLRNTGITVLDLSRNCIGDEGVCGFAGILKDTQIITLNLSANMIGDEGARALANGLKHSRITSLDLSRNAIGDGVVDDFANSLMEIRMVSLDLSSNSFSFQGREKIELFFNKWKWLETYVKFRKMFCENQKDLVLDYIDLSKVISERKESYIGRFEKFAIDEDEKIRVENLVLNVENNLADFISQLDLSCVERVRFLLICQENGLCFVVERLLLHRDHYLLFETENFGVLHPAVYLLMIEYDLPWCFRDMRPTKVDLIETFTSPGLIQLVNDDSVDKLQYYQQLNKNIINSIYSIVSLNTSIDE